MAVQCDWVIKRKDGTTKKSSKTEANVPSVGRCQNIDGVWCKTTSVVTGKFPQHPVTCQADELEPEEVLKEDKEKMNESETLEVETSEDDIQENFAAPQGLTKLFVKRTNYKWKFHKTDNDTWPSPIHGHDYEKGLTIDAITGSIFDKATKKKVDKLRPRDLLALQNALRDSKDFKDKTSLHLP